jgi:predicted RNA-binding protein with PUA-like domain
VNSGAKQLQMPGVAVLGSIVMLHHSGDTAWTNFRDNKGVQWDIRMARQNGRWRITEVKNVEQLLRRFQQQRMGGGATPPPDGVPDSAPPGGVPSGSP